MNQHDIGSEMGWKEQQEQFSYGMISCNTFLLLTLG